MSEPILRDLLDQELITPDDAEWITLYASKKPFSLHWELKTLLYLGVILLNVGLGMLIYENIDTIGHAALIAAIGLVSAACLWYAIRHRTAFSYGPTVSPTPYYDYILLLGCLSFLIMEGYWQYQYQIFGNRYGLATLIPAVLFFGLAYWLDNRGVLSLGITAFAAWLGITLTPQKLLVDNDFNSETMVATGVLLGGLLTLIPFLSERKDFKQHFSPTYLNFGVHIGMISCLAGMIVLDRLWVYLPLFLLAVTFYFWYARKQHSFYFLLVAVIYGYIGLTYLIFRLMDYGSLEWVAYFYMFYFIASCTGIIVFLTNYKRFFKKDLP